MTRVSVGDVILSDTEPGIVTVDYGTALATVDLVQDVIERSQELWAGRRVGMIVRIGSATDLAKIGKLVGQEEIADYLIAAAIVTPGKLAEMMGNLYMQMQSSSYPQRQFADADKALVWLRRQVAQDEGNR